MRQWRALVVLAAVITGAYAQENSTELWTPNDPFRALALKVVEPPSEPICCLNPRSAPESEEFLSFEEWKAKRHSPQEIAKEQRDGASKAAPNHTEPANPDARQTDAAREPAPQESPAVQTETVSPHFRVPLTDRFNYANMDCSARVHTTHRSAKSPEAILSHKKDRYMLSPCAPPDGGGRFVVVELCDDIRIDTVQLANFEFFSGVFQDFRVSVSKTYTTDAAEWVVVGEYRAKNVRAVQSFHPPTSLRDFYRFIRIDFLSNYGAEYYCPLSLLRVYGLTHLEQWKWDEWDAESRARLEESSQQQQQQQWVDMVTPEPEVPIPAASLIPVNTPNPTAKKDAPPPISVALDASTLIEEVIVVTSAPIPTDVVLVSHNLHSTDTWTVIDASSPDVLSLSIDVASSDPSQATRIYSTELNVVSSAGEVLTIISSENFSAEMPSNKIFSTAEPSSPSAANTSTVESSEKASGPSMSTKATSVVSSGSATAVAASVVPTQPSSVSGESIYRTIMNRLNMLEANTTLYTRYVEEQTRSIRDALRRLEEEVGRLEGIGKAQTQVFQRTIHEWEVQKNRLQVEHEELLSRMDFLADEVVLEKRLGIAQLCLLLTVLVFMGLTRGSRGESLINHTASTIHRLSEGSRFSRAGGWRERGIRTLSFNGNWVKAFRNRSESPGSGSGRANTPTSVSRKQPTDITDDLVPFPKAQSRTEHLPVAGPSSQSNYNTVSSNGNGGTLTKRRHPKSHSRPHTPTLRHVMNPSPPTSSHGQGQDHAPPSSFFAMPAPHGARLRIPGSVGGGRPQLQRSHSSHLSGIGAGVGGVGTGGAGSATVIGPVPRSARRWARSAHIHEARPARRGTSVDAVVGAHGEGSGPIEVDGENLGGAHGAAGRGPVLAAAQLAKGRAKLSESGGASSLNGRDASGWRQPLSPLVLDQTHFASGSRGSRPALRRGVSSEADESDAWLDTDADVSAPASEAGHAEDIAVDVDV